jgi:nicotinamidase-related amidase
MTHKVNNTAMSSDYIFWDEDTQVDFILPRGKLYAPGAEHIIPNLEQLTQHARRNHLLVVASVDAHQPDDAEFMQWPPHCIAGTPGQQKIPETKLEDAYIVPNVPVELPADFNNFGQIVVEKQTVDVFTNPNIGRVLQKLGKPPVTLYGVVTEVCVAIAARGLLDRGYRVRLVRDAIWPFNQEEGNKSLRELKARGAELVTTEEILRSSRSLLPT